MCNRTCHSVGICLALLLTTLRWVAQPVRGQSADPATTRPLSTTRPADELPAESPIRIWFARLADPDPRVREQAREDLMGISGDDLPKLRQLVIENLPISPNQASALRDVVLQAYLASEKYSIPSGGETDSTGTEGPFFLGMLWGPDTATDLRLGVTVDERLPGFPSYRYLRKGDMILGIFMDPTAPLLQLPNMETHDVASLKGAISAAPRNQNIQLQVLRNGELILVSLKMAPRPSDADQNAVGALKAFTSSRAERADMYWHENFAPLLDSADQEQ